MDDLDDGYVLWLGGIFDDDTMMRRPGVNPAGRRWQKGLVEALRRQGVRVVVLGHAPESVWPKGCLRDRGTDPLEPGLEGEAVGYWNVPVLRMASLTRSYRRGFERIRARHGDPALVLGYNTYPYNVALGRRVQRLLGIPWTCIIADVPEPGRARERHDAAVNEAAGRVFLSWGEYSDANHASPKLHLDGGIDEFRFGDDDPEPTGGPILLYTGSFGRWGGVTLLVDAFRRVRRRDVELWICGRGNGAPLERAAADDERIRLLGLVSEGRLRQVSREASVFVNPRPSSIPGNAGNFPSKLFEYLSYGKPVVSTWTAGISPEYRRVLAVVEDETVDGFTATLEDVISWGPERRRALRAEIREFVETKKTWDAQAARLADWMRREVGRTRVPA